MSHQPERKEKDCLNCGTMVEGRYCHDCGQENIVTHQNFWSLSKHFIFDIFHFDGKFFDTLKYLFYKPGFVAREYISGKRVSYLDPIRMYLFTSALFFLIFFSLNDFRVRSDIDLVDELSLTDRMKVAVDLQAQLKNGQRTEVNSKAIALLLDSSQIIELEELDKPNDSSIIYQGDPYFLLSRLDSLKMYPDSVLKDAGWLERQWIRKKSNKVDTRYGGDMGNWMSSLLDTFVHKLPYLLFISLPFFALILKLLYARRKNFFYSDHAVFTLYHYIFSFLLLLLLFGLKALRDFSGWGIFSWLLFFGIIGWFIHLYKGMRNFYQQSRRKTVLKFFLLNFIGFFVILLLFTAFAAFIAYQF